MHPRSGDHRDGTSAMRGWLLVALAFGIGLAGCLGTDGNDTDGGPTDAGTGGDAPRFGAASGLPDARAATTTTLATAPAWAVGEWWAYEMTSPRYDIDEPIAFTVVVAGAEDGTYLVGYPADDVPVLPFILHQPGTGKLRMSDLAYDAHDEPFELLAFPLEQGASWDALFWGSAPMTVSVEAVDGRTAQLRMETSNYAADYVYDAGLGTISSLDVEAADGTGGWSLDVVDHGFGYEGLVRVPYGQDLVLCHGRATVLLSIEACAAGDPAPPQGEVHVPEGYDAATFALLLDSGVAEGEQPPGVMAISVTDPAGDRYDAAMADRVGGRLLVGHHTDAASGTWTYEASAGGAGFALLEGAAYQVYDVRLPSGCTEAPTDTCTS